jgi:broad specificity phosphatase PhoE
MRQLEVRRHSFTKKGDNRGRGSALSSKGVAAARAVGTRIGPVIYVAASQAPRTVETAIAMGYAVDDILPMGSGYVGRVAHHDQWSWPDPFLRYQQLLDDDAALAEAADRELKLWRMVLDRVSEHGKALIVSHGGIIEPTLVAAVPGGDYPNWGQPFSHLDGVRLAFDDGQFLVIDFDRYPLGDAEGWSDQAR